MNIVKIKFHQRQDERGALSFLESERDISFAIKRVYYIYGSHDSAKRGYHAHKTLQQYLVCTHGQCRILLDDGKGKEIVLLDDPNEGLYIGPNIWHEMYDFSGDAVLLVLASDYYDEADYIRDYNLFLTYCRGSVE